MRVFVLTKIGVRGGNPDVRHQKQFVRHVPGIAVHGHDERLAEEGLTLGQRIDHSLARDPGLVRRYDHFERLDIDPPREVLAVTEENGCP
jgi:hypothetical protein